MLRLDGIRAGYEGTQVLSDVTLAAEKGAMTVLIGPNGAGKSTTLKVVNGLVRPTQGHVVFRGEDITRTPAHQRPGCLGHRVHVKRPAHVPAALPVDGRPGRPVQVPEPVAPPARRVAGVEVVRRLAGAQHGHVRREPGVERGRQPVHREPPRVMEAGHLALGVRAGIGASRGMDRGRLGRHVADGAPQLALDRAVADLELPAGEAGAVVLEDHPDVAQDRISSARRRRRSPASVACLQKRGGRATAQRFVY